jgi:ADP-heptose:LPS heptosyltransferase
MSQEHLSQDEIDRLTKTFLSGEEIDTSQVQHEADNVLAIPKSKTMLAMISRLEWTRKNGSYDDVIEARKALHEAAFNLWLAKKRMTRWDYYNLINRELSRRGYPQFFNVR